VRQDPALEQEWLRRNNLSYGGLIAIGVFMLHRRPQQRDRDALATLGRLHVHTGDGPHRQVIQRRQGPRLLDSPLAQTAAPCPPWTRFLVE
jgi:hypothetical protein